MVILEIRVCFPDTFLAEDINYEKFILTVIKRTFMYCLELRQNVNGWGPKIGSLMITYLNKNIPQVAHNALQCQRKGVHDYYYQEYQV